MAKITKYLADSIQEEFTPERFIELQVEFPFIMSRLHDQKSKLTRFNDFYKFYCLLMDSNSLADFKFRLFTTFELHLLADLFVTTLQEIIDHRLLTYNQVRQFRFFIRGLKEALRQHYKIQNEIKYPGESRKKYN